MKSIFKLDNGDISTFNRQIFQVIPHILDLSLNLQDFRNNWWIGNKFKLCRCVMRKVIIIFALVLVTVSLSGCLGTQVSQIDQLTDTINDHISTGDNYFNQAATSTNKYQYEAAQSQADNASSQFSDARTSTQEALIYAKNLQDQVYVTYLQITLQELDAKINATNQLKVAIPLFARNDTKTANTHVDNANQFMDASQSYQKQREEIVQQNPAKFK